MKGIERGALASIHDYDTERLGRNVALKAGNDLIIPLLAATGTTVAAFSPIALARSGVGVYCNSLPIVIGTVLLSSFLVAMTLAPLLCVWFLKRTKPKEKKESMLKKNLPKPDDPGLEISIHHDPYGAGTVFHRSANSGQALQNLLSSIRPWSVCNRHAFTGGHRYSGNLFPQELW